MKLSEEQKREVTLIASVGCDRETMAKYIGCSMAALEGSFRSDTSFAASVRRAEAACELAHMRNIQQAARDERYWRASVWWLERRAPERYARRDADSVGRRDLIRFLGSAAGAIAEVVRSDGDRRRVLERLGELSESVADPLQLPCDAANTTVEQVAQEGE